MVNHHFCLRQFYSNQVLLTCGLRAIIPVIKEIAYVQFNCQNPSGFQGQSPGRDPAHFKAAREEFHKSLEGILPPDFVEHHRKARREMLLAWRSLIDSSIEQMDKKPPKGK